MRRLLLLLPIIIAIGCARTSSTTEVNADGSWKRTVKLTVSKQEGMQSPGVDQIFQVPSGPGWTTTKNTKKDEIEWTFTRSAKLDELISKDIAINEMDKEGKPKGLILVNEVTVKQIAPNRFKYRETFKWVGKKDKPDKDMEDVLPLKQVLPAELQKPEDLKKVMTQMEGEMLHVMFGPGDPLIASLMTNPEYGIRKLMNRIAKSFDKVLTEVYGDRLPMDDRRKIVAKIVQSASESVVEKKKNEANDPSSSSAPPITMYMSVKLPGKIVETDGEVDPYTGEVFWSMYPEAASMGEVSIMATCEVGG
jgi:hypothetical protein